MEEYETLMVEYELEEKKLNEEFKKAKKAVINL